MKSFPNIERAWHTYRGSVVGKRDEYLGYSDKAPTPFRITKNRTRGGYTWQAVGTILNADNREAVKIIYAKDLAEMSKRLEHIGMPWVGWDAGKVSTNRRRGLRKKRCWKGYKPVKGKRPYSKGSCRRVLKRNAYSAVATPKSLAKFFAFQKDGNTENYTAFLPKAEEYFARGEGQEAQRLMLRFMRLERGNDVDLRRLQGNPAMFVQTMGDVENVRKMVARGKVIEEMSYTSNGLRLLIQDPNSRNKSIPFEEFKAAFDRMDMLASRGKIPRRKAIAMLRAGLPLSRSELRGNPFDLPSRNELLRLKRADARGYAFTKKFSSRQPQALDMLISKLSILKGNRDENLVTFFIRKRPKNSRDYVVILKHRKYVDGARVYSAGQKAEGAIGQFATILGAKAKRVGKSDYVFTSYGIRFPEERKKSSPGKLFPNNGLPDLVNRLRKHPYVAGFMKRPLTIYTAKKKHFFKRGSVAFASDMADGFVRLHHGTRGRIDTKNFAVLYITDLDGKFVPNDESLDIYG